jgi:bacterioferritin-associated ferredoxin
MFVCVCRAVSDERVRKSIEEGARTREEVSRACGAGGDCGACHAMIEDMIEGHCEATGPSEALVPAHRICRTRAA